MVGSHPSNRQRQLFKKKVYSVSTSTASVSKQRYIDAAVAAFRIACSGLPFRFNSDGSVDSFDDLNMDHCESAIVNIVSTATCILTMRSFIVARFWLKHKGHHYGCGRAVLRRLFPDDWRKREGQIYEWARIAKLVPPDDIDYTKPWEYYRKVYGRTSDARRSRWQDIRAYRDGDKIVFVEARNGRDEIHAKPISEILPLLLNVETGEVLP